MGNKTFVDCTESRKIINECSQLRICALSGSNDLDTVESLFPSSFIRTAFDFPELVDMIDEGVCNVMVADVFYLVQDFIYDAVVSGRWVFGSLLSFKYLAMVMRNDDAQWNDITHGTVDAMLRASWNGVAAQNLSLCPLPLSTTNSLDINFLSAPTCLGDSFQVNDVAVPEDFREKTLLLFNGIAKIPESDGMVWAESYGNLGCSLCPNALEKGTLQIIDERSVLNCGVVQDETNPGLTIMGETYCKAIAVAIFHGDDGTRVNITRVSSFGNTTEALSNGEFDLIAGGSRYSTKGAWSPDLSGWSAEKSGDFDFSVPYYYSSLDE